MRIALSPPTPSADRVEPMTIEKSASSSNTTSADDEGGTMTRDDRKALEGGNRPPTGCPVAALFRERAGGLELNACSTVTGFIVMMRVRWSTSGTSNICWPCTFTWRTASTSASMNARNVVGGPIPQASAAPNRPARLSAYLLTGGYDDVVPALGKRLEQDHAIVVGQSYA
jgi:hypothetical protein